MTELVIAYYKEYDSLDNFKMYSEINNYDIHIYNKGGIENNDIINSKFSNFKNNFNLSNLPNIGQATHTYLHHVISNYDNLSDITIFMLGSGFRGEKKAKKAHWILKNANNCNGFLSQHIWLSEKNDYNFELPYYEIFSYKNNNIQENSQRIKTEMIRAESLPLGKWIENNTHNKLISKRFYRTNKCMFAVKKDVILKKPISYYKNLIKQLESANRNLEVIHFFERAWVCVFLEPNKDIEYYREKLTYDIKKYGITV